MPNANEPDMKTKVFAIVLTVMISVAVTVATYNVSNIAANRERSIEHEKDIAANAKAIERLEVSISDLMSELRRLNETLTQLRITLEKKTKDPTNGSR